MLPIYPPVKLKCCVRYTLSSVFAVNTKGTAVTRGFAAQSDTETYAELKLAIHNTRWAGVPIYIRTGKALNRTGTEIGVRFKRLPGMVFDGRNSPAEHYCVSHTAAGRYSVGMASRSRQPNGTHGHQHDFLLYRELLIRKFPKRINGCF